MGFETDLDGENVEGVGGEGEEGGGARGFYSSPRNTVVRFYGYFACCSRFCILFLVLFFLICDLVCPYDMQLVAHGISCLSVIP